MSLPDSSGTAGVSNQLPFDLDVPSPSAASPASDAAVAAEAEAAVPGLRYVPDWVTPAEAEALLAAIDAEPWSGELRRRVQHYGQRYDYGRRSVSGGSRSSGARAAAPPLPGWARRAAARLAGEGVLDREADQVIVNEYQPGQGISAHVDCVPCFGPVIAAISLGSGCVMDFTHPAERAETDANGNGNGKVKVSLRLAPRSLLVMAGPARYSWHHAIAARKSDPVDPAAAAPTRRPRVPRGRRVSITFRTLIPSAGPARSRPGPG